MSSTVKRDAVPGNSLATDLPVGFVRIGRHKLRALYPLSVCQAKQSAHQAKATHFVDRGTGAGGLPESSRQGKSDAVVFFRNPL